MYTCRSMFFNLEPLVTTIADDPAQSSPLYKLTDELEVARIFAVLEHAGLKNDSATALDEFAHED